MGPCKGDLPVPTGRGTTLPRRPTTHKSKYKVQKYSTSRYKSRAPAAASSRSQFIDLHYEYSRIAYESYSTFREPTVNLHCTRTAFKGAVQQLYGRSEGRTTVQLYRPVRVLVWATAVAFRSHQSRPDMRRLLLGLSPGSAWLGLGT